MRPVRLAAIVLLLSACAGRPPSPPHWQPVAGAPLAADPALAWTVAGPPAAFDGGTGDANARATARLAAAGAAWTWDLAYDGRAPYDYGEIACPAGLPGGAAAVGVRWLPDPGSPAPVLRLRLRDATGEIHQFTADRGEPGADGWALAVFRLGHADAAWGGDGDRILAAPAAIQSLVADRPWPGWRGAQRVLVEPPRLLAPRPPAADAGLRLEADAPPPGHCYEAGAVARLRALLPRGVLRWTIAGLDGAVLARGEGAAPEARIDIPLAGPCWRECRIEAEDGAARSAIAYRCAVLAPGEARHPGLGVCVHVLVRRRDPWPLEALDLVPRLGLGSVREELAWNEVERPAGAFALPGHHRTVLERMRALALDPLLILYPGHRDHGDGWPLTPAARAAFAGYAARAAAALPWVRRFEVWNEWSAGTGIDTRRHPLGPNRPEAYAALLAEAAPAVRAVRPDAELAGIGGESITAPRPHLGAGLPWRAMLGAGAGAHMAAASFHPYRWADPPEPTGLLAEVAGAAGAVRELGGPRRLWITEIGWTSPPQGPGTSLREQAAFTARALALLAAVPEAERIWLYDLLDDGTDPADKEHHFGLFHHRSLGLMPKPAAVAVAAFARATAGAACRGAIARDGAWAVRWTLPDGGDLVMAWALAGAPPLAAVVRGAASIATDAAGAPLPAVPDRLGSWPVYLRGRDLALAGGAGR